MEIQMNLMNFIYSTWVRASWIEFNNCPARCNLINLLHFCRQLYMFRVLTPIIRSSYNCNYGFWYWLTGSTTIQSRCWVGTDSCVSYGRSTPETCRTAYTNVFSPPPQCHHMPFVYFVVLWAWQECNAVTLSRWCVSGDRGVCRASRGLKPKFLLNYPDHGHRGNLPLQGKFPR